jgi:hypothetical protein
MSHIRSFSWLLPAILLLFLGACSAPPPDAKVQKESRAAYDQLASDDIAGFQARMLPETRALATAEKIESIRRVLPSGKPTSIRFVRWTTMATSAGPQSVSIAEQYEYPQAYVLFESVFARTPGAPEDQLAGFNVRTATRAQIDAQKVGLVGKSPVQYGFLALVVLIWGLMIAAIIDLIRHPIQWRWLWLISVLFGFGKVSLNWSTGAIAWQLISINLLGVGMVRGGSDFDPWILSISAPVFAIMVLVQKGKPSKPRKPKIAPLDS